MMSSACTNAEKNASKINEVKIHKELFASGQKNKSVLFAKMLVLPIIVHTSQL